MLEEELLGKSKVKSVLRTFFMVGIFTFALVSHKKILLFVNRQIMDLGFDDKFIRTWEYYFDYCAPGFKTLTLEDYQVTH